MADVREHEKIEIEKTSESIRKKHRTLENRKSIESKKALDRYFKPLIEPLRLFVDIPGVRATKRESRDEDAASVSKHERKEEDGRGTRGGRKSERDVRAFRDSA